MFVVSRIGCTLYSKGCHAVTLNTRQKLIMQEFPVQLFENALKHNYMCTSLSVGHRLSKLDPIPNS